MKFQKGNKFGKGGTTNPPGGRPTKEETIAKAEMRAASLDALCGGMVKAVQALIQKVDSKNEAIAIRAASSVIEYAFKSFETEELEARITALEERLQEAK